MMSTIVNGSIETLQLFALVALILFIVAGVVAFMERSVWNGVVCAGLAFVSLAIMFHP
jgi:hypothetical protein